MLLPVEPSPESGTIRGGDDLKLGDNFLTLAIFALIVVIVLVAKVADEKRQVKCPMLMQEYQEWLKGETGEQFYIGDVKHCKQYNN